MEHLVTNESIMLDQEKVEAISKMPKPNDFSGVKRFCGMILYLSRLMPSLSNDLAPLRKLTKNILNDTGIRDVTIF